MARLSDLPNQAGYLQPPTNTPQTSVYSELQNKLSSDKTELGGSIPPATSTLALHGVQAMVSSNGQQFAIGSLAELLWENGLGIAINSRNSYHGNSIVRISGIPVVNATFIGLSHAPGFTPRQLTESGLIVVANVPGDPRDSPGESYKLWIQKIGSLLSRLFNILSRLSRKRDLSTTTIITSSGNRFRVKTDLLVKNSEYFATMLRSSSRWAESQQGIVRMADTNKDAFCIYGIWLVTGEIQVDRLLSLFALLRTSVYAGSEKSVCKERIRMAKLELLLECYILGDYLQAPLSFLDLVMSHIIECYGDIYKLSDGKVPLGNLQDIWEKTYPGTPLRHVIVDMLLSCLSNDTMAEAVKLGILSEDIYRAVTENLNTHIADGTEPLPPWSTYYSRYFMYARSTLVNPKKKTVSTVAVLPFWDVPGSELQLPAKVVW